MHSLTIFLRTSRDTSRGLNIATSIVSSLLPETKEILSNCDILSDHPVRHDAGLQEHHHQRGAGQHLGRGGGQAGGERQADEEGGCQESIRQTCQETLVQYNTHNPC